MNREWSFHVDAQTFDRWTAAVAHHPSRRGAVRLLAGALLGGLLTHRATVPAAAQRPDRDGDGLYDDDETDIYGTNPDVYDTDGDGVGDGEEVYVGTDPRPPVGGGGACPAGQADCGNGCIGITSDALNCGDCGVFCDFAGGRHCEGGVCVANTPAGCAAGLTACGPTCVDLLTDQNNCGSCGRVCGASESCFGGACLASSQGGGRYVDRCAQMYVFGRECNGTCVDLDVDPNNCGRCGKVCTGPGYSGACVWGGCWRN
jgi:hypothetical protein